MAKKKQDTNMPSTSEPVRSDRHTTPRRGVNLDYETHAILTQLAEAGDRPIQWELRRLIREAARQAGILPPDASD